MARLEMTIFNSEIILTFDIEKHFANGDFSPFHGLP